ncbi:hypothetical protein STRAU_0084 [Streptomyces aurantiacus JA 4570]|uniref:Uncharacterized protein n=2 Tax=Streptomyces aurantiacus TaxID=47760 RepID=S3ZUP7_9ACTN|nr:hypothetical protein STRAU_0084 [Streptomyces aurantiacus JA 4570]
MEFDATDPDSAAEQAYAHCRNGDEEDESHVSGDN